MGKLYVYLCIVLLFCTMCKKQTDIAIGFSSLNGSDYILKADRVSQAPGVRFPADRLDESYYTATDEDITHEVTFSEDGKIVSILPGPVNGELTNDGKTTRFYELDNGLAAGGRFVIWINGLDFEAEFTVYGSGVSIIKSKRGKMVLKEK